MKQCPRCNRSYADDALLYCLEDGAGLVRKIEVSSDATTMINPFPPVQNVMPPTVAYEPHPSPATPAPRQRSPWMVGVLVVTALVIGLAVGGVALQLYNSSLTAAPSVTPSLDPASTNANMPTPASPTPTPTPRSTPSPVAAVVPTPSPIVTPTPEQKAECVLVNDKSDKSVVRVRADCDKRDCDNDASTIAGEYPDNTPVRVYKGISTQGARFTWVKVSIISSGRTVWVASTKVKCR